MKKFFAFIAATAMVIACSDSNPTDAFENTSSAKGNENTQRMNWTENRYYSFIDTTHLKYYHLHTDCILDETTNKFSWISDEYKGFVNIDTMSRESRNWHGFFSYKLSNDTLYECDYNGEECTDMSQVKAANVFTGSSKSLFGKWNYVGRIYEGTYIENEQPVNIEMTITPTGTTEKYSYEYEVKPLFYSNNFCGLLHDLFYKRNDLGNSCHDYFKNIGKHKGNYSHYNPQTRDFETIPDTVKLEENFWITSTAFDEVLISIDNMIFNVKYQESIIPEPLTYERNKMITYNGITCQNSSKNLNRLSKEVCEASTVEKTATYEEYCEITGKTEKFFKKNDNNNEEFYECIKQFNLPE